MESIISFLDQVSGHPPDRKDGDKGSHQLCSMPSISHPGSGTFISKSNGRALVKIDPVQWAKKVEEYGAGEIIITSVNNEGLKQGYDIKLTKKIVEAVSLPVIAHGGAGTLEHIYDVIRYANVSGVGIASMLHYDAVNFLPKSKTKIGNTQYLQAIKKKTKEQNTIQKIKNYLKKRKIVIRDEK